jgi:putative NADH-flavin reductase/uncharacterized protein with HEPN domain
MKVALLGADGKLGPAILHALLNHNFQVTALKRASSKSPDNYPSSVSVARLQDDFAVDAITPALSGHDAVIVTIQGSQTDIQRRLAQACIKAGVKRFIPADFGSVDASSPRAQALVPLYKHKDSFRKQLVEMARENQSFSFTNLVCGHFFDWSLDFMHIWLRDRRMDIITDGTTKASASTLSRIGEATARILENLEPTKNKMIYVQSFCVSQNELLHSFEKATGSKWEVTRHEPEEFEKEVKQKADAGDRDAVEELVWYLGNVDADWTGKEDFAMEMLGLEDESLDEVAKRCVEEFT